MKKQLATAVLVTGLGLIGCAKNVAVSPIGADVKFSGVKVTSSAISKLSEGELAAIQSDLEIMKGWTEAEKQYFIDNFVYKRIEIRNDTLVFIK